jgi:hypothetical protein
MKEDDPYCYFSDVCKVDDYWNMMDEVAQPILPVQVAVEHVAELNWVFQKNSCQKCRKA